MIYKYFVLALFLLPATVIHAEEFSTYFLMDSFAYSEPVAITAIIDDWDDQLHSGDVALAFTRFEAGFGWKQWRLGVFRRYDYYYEFSPDTAYLKHQAENKLSLKNGEQLAIYLAANTVVANGLSLSHSLTSGEVSLDIRASYLKGKRFSSGSLTGNARVLADKDYDMEFDVDYYYSEDELFDREVTSPDGDGYSLDININWHPTNNWNLNLNVNDLLAKMFWKNAPRTLAAGSTDTKEFDENGYVIFNPVISGLETNQDYSQTLPKRIRFTSAYALGEKSILFEFLDYEIKQFYSFGLEFNSEENESIALFYNATASALKAEYKNPWFKCSVLTDEFQLPKARTFALEFMASIPF